MKIISESSEELFDKLLSAESETSNIRSAIGRIRNMPERDRFWEHNILLRLHERLFASEPHRVSEASTAAEIEASDNKVIREAARIKP